jgi:hypothetical protein
MRSLLGSAPRAACDSHLLCGEARALASFSCIARQFLPALPTGGTGLHQTDYHAIADPVGTVSTASPWANGECVDRMNAEKRIS